MAQILLHSREYHSRQGTLSQGGFEGATPPYIPLIQQQLAMLK